MLNFGNTNYWLCMSFNLIKLQKGKKEETGKEIYLTLWTNLGLVNRTEEESIAKQLLSCQINFELYSSELLNKKKLTMGVINHFRRA